ncbi:MAG TPA: 16S rRNA (cytidine(1402)-2'-O)-methyltransferase [Steroidobacteraceae bacterium]|nr:16S rRNA (cytidine(1402)-2'-O)-methyltransferase [Steroidobacteraceae bacterium]
MAADTQRGRLSVIATPIGNLADLSARARRALEQADVIAAEDTRRTQVLLRETGIARPLLSLHAHNESQRLPQLLGRLAEGARVALVSDAGTPLVSDPGYELVRAAIADGFQVEAIPGPSAVTAALAVAGLPASRFCFEGFLPAAPGERRTRLAALAGEARTMVFFEAPHRIADCLVDMSTALGPQRPAAVARELTKVHESIYRGTLAELAARAASDPDVARGEITLVVQGAPQEPGADRALMRRVVSLLVQELPPGRVAQLAAAISGCRRADAYDFALSLRSRGGHPGDVPADAAQAPAQDAASVPGQDAGSAPTQDAVPAAAPAQDSEDSADDFRG